MITIFRHSLFLVLSPLFLFMTAGEIVPDDIDAAQIQYDSISQSQTPASKSPERWKSLLS